MSQRDHRPATGATAASSLLGDRVNFPPYVFLPSQNKGFILPNRAHTFIDTLPVRSDILSIGTIFAT